MFTEAQLEEYVIRRSLSEAARNVIRTVRSSPPTRRVKSGYSSVSCRYPSLKMGWVIQAESNKNELPAVVGWDFDKFTHEIYDQPTPVKMTYHNATGRKVTHMSTPDYFLLQDEFTGWIECKTEDWLKAKLAEGSGLFTKDENGKWRCLPGEQYAAELGLGFRVRSSAESNWTKLRNIEFLTDYYDERCPPVKDADIKVIREAMGDQAWITVKQLLDSGCSSDALYTMVTDGLLFFDLDNFLITEPERAQIFRDAEAFDTYRIYLESQRLPAVAPLRSVQLVNGTVFNWDGKPWRILNVGNEDVFMEDDEHVISSLKNNVFVGLAKKGVITGLPESVDVNREEIDQLIRSAGPSDLKHALIRYRCLFPDLQAKSLPKVTDRSIRNWRSLFRKSEQAYGSGFFGLIPKIHLRGNRNRKIDQEVIELMESEIDLNLQPEAKSWVVCWGAVRNLCIEKGLVPPSEVTFRNAVKQRRSNDIIVAREGEKAAYSDSEYIWYLEATSPRHGERPFEIGHIDHTQLDLQFVGARNGEKMGKAWLTVLIDAFTRVILAWVLMFDEPSYRSCMAVIRECVKRHGRIPKNIVVDNGADFDSEYFECLLPRLGATKKTRPGNKPRFGSIIERFFGLNNEEFVHNLIGNNKALQKPRSMSATHDPRDLAVWTLPAFTDGFEGFLTNVYSCIVELRVNLTQQLH